MNRRTRDEQGSAVVEFVWLAVVLLVPLVWILTSVFEVQRGAFAVSAAARAAGRAYVLSPDVATAQQRADAAARRVLEDQGGEEMPVKVEVTCSEGPTACLAPASSITVTVLSGVELPYLPSFFSSAETDFSLEASHTLPVGQYVEEAP